MELFCITDSVSCLCCTKGECVHRWSVCYHSGNSLTVPLVVCTLYLLPSPGYNCGVFVVIFFLIVVSVTKTKKEIKELKKRRAEKKLVTSKRITH